MWKFNLIVSIISLTTVHCSFINEHVRHARRANTTQKYSVEDLLTMTFPYSDPRTDNNQYFMDPCKAGRL
jgi:hypothetical protein